MIYVERLLLVDDDLDLCDLLKEYLEAEGFTLESANDGRSGLERVLEGGIRLVILDVMMPEMGGFEVLRELRAHSPVPVIMLTARGDDVDRIVGLEMGADDYLPKPFNPRELVARIKAILRRGQRTEESVSNNLNVGDLVLDPGARSVRIGGDPVDLTSVEFNLLEALLGSAGQVVPRESLVLHVLKRSYSPFDRSIDVHISNLRKKLGHYSDGSDRIKTLRGEGYFFASPPEAVSE